MMNACRGLGIDRNDFVVGAPGLPAPWRTAGGRETRRNPEQYVSTDEPHARQPAAGPKLPPYGPSVTLAQARQVADAALAPARENGWTMVIAIVRSRRLPRVSGEDGRDTGRQRRHRRHQSAFCRHLQAPDQDVSRPSRERWGRAARAAPAGRHPRRKAAFRSSWTGSWSVRSACRAARAPKTRCAPRPEPRRCRSAPFGMNAGNIRSMYF